MKKLLLAILMVGLSVSACKDGGEDPKPIDQFSNNLEGTVAGKAISATSSSIVPTFYSDAGESSGSLEVVANLAGGEKLTFFLDEAVAGTINLTQAFPAVMEGNSYGLRTKASGANEKVLAVPVSYVKYFQSSSTFFAISGKIVVKIDGPNLTFDWEVTFKDAQGNTFTSKGSTKVKDYQTNLKPRSQINSPTSNLSIVSITPAYGKAGTEVTIKGTSFSALKTENKVKLGEVAVEPSAASATEIKLIVPENGSHGKFTVEVLGETVESNLFHYEPKVTSADKASAKVGEQFTISGSHFDLAKETLEVKVGTKVQEIVSATLSSLVVKIPAGTETGKISVARIGHPAVEGPELSISTEPITVGPPVTDIFETISGNLTYQEVLVNSHEAGHFWSFEIDKEKNILYAVGEKGLVAVDLSTMSSSKIADHSSEIYRSELGIINYATLPVALYPSSDGFLYGIKSVISVPYSSQNVFKMNLATKQVTMLGTGKVSSGAAFNSIFVGANKGIYVPEFTTGYLFSQYDENLANRKVLVEGMTGGLPDEVISMGPSKVRLIRDRSLTNMKYHEIDGSSASGPVAIGSLLNDMKVPSASLVRMIGMDAHDGNVYGLFGGGTGNIAQFPQMAYRIGVQPGGAGNFQNKGEFKIKQTFQYQGTTYYMRAWYTFFNIVGVDKQGNMYILIATPADTNGTSYAPGTGGIYKISF